MQAIDPLDYALDSLQLVLPRIVYRSVSGQRPATLRTCLGMEVPRWVRNQLAHSRDILQASIETSLATVRQRHACAQEKSIALGCDVESVSIRKSEIEASVELVQRVAPILGRQRESEPPRSRPSRSSIHRIKRARGCTEGVARSRGRSAAAAAHAFALGGRATERLDPAGVESPSH